MADKQLIDETVSTMQAAIDVFQGPASSCPIPPSKEQINQLLERVKMDASKIGTVWSDATAADMKSLLNSFQQSVVAFCACCHNFTADAGSSLKGDLSKAAGAVVEPCKTLVHALSKATAASIINHVGQVWDACEAAKKVPLDNKSSLFKHLGQTLLVIKDTMKEVAELIEDADEASNSGQQHGTADAQDGGSKHEGSKGDPEEEDEEEEDSEDLLDTPLSASEKHAAMCARQLMEVAASGLSKLSKLLLQGPDLGPGAPSLEAWESSRWHCRGLQQGVEDLGAALYAPQDIEEVKGAAGAVYNSLELMLEECPEEVCIESVRQEMEGLQKKLESVYQELQSAW